MENASVYTGIGDIRIFGCFYTRLSKVCLYVHLCVFMSIFSLPWETGITCSEAAWGWLRFFRGCLRIAWSGCTERTYLNANSGRSEDGSDWLCNCTWTVEEPRLKLVKEPIGARHRPCMVVGNRHWLGHKYWATRTVCSLDRLRAPLRSRIRSLIHSGKIYFRCLLSCSMGTLFMRPLHLHWMAYPLCCTSIM